jgi:hypothetical protein
MKLRRCRALLLGAILPGFTTLLAAQATMTGIVREDSSARPLEGVEVLINGTAHRTMTGANGRYLLEGLPAGIYQAIFRSVGHIPMRMDVLLTVGESTRANATLVRSDVVLDPIVVTGEADRPWGIGLEAFEERRKMGFGRFIDSATLRRSEHIRMADLLRRHAGIEVRAARIAGAPGWVALNPTGRDITGAPNCLMSIYLDGNMVGRGGVLGKTGQCIGPGGNCIDVPDLGLFDLTSVEAVEVYRRASEIPVQFGGAMASCGVIAIWSRRR